MLGHEEAVDTLAQIIVAPVDTVQVHRHGPPGLVNHLGAVQIHQPGLHAVHHAGPYTVVAAVAQHEGLVLRVGPVLKQLGLEGFRPVEGLGPELHGLLRQVKAEVARQLKLGALAEQLRAVLQVHFHIALAPDLAVFAVDRILEGQHTGLLHHVVAGDQQAGFLVPQHVRVAAHRHDGHAVVGVDEIAAGDDFAGLQAAVVGIGPGPQHHGGAVQLQGFAMVGRGGLGGNGAVGGVVHRGTLGHKEAGAHRGVIQPRRGDEGGRLGVAPEARAVGRHGRGRVIIKKARQPDGAAIGHVGTHFRQVHFVNHPALGRGKADGFALGTVKPEAGVQLGRGGQISPAVAEDDLVFPGGNIAALGELPLPAAAQVVRKAVAGQIHRGLGGIVDFNPVREAVVLIHQGGLVGGHHLGDVHAGLVQGAEVVVHLRLAALVVGQAGGRHLAHGEGAVPAPGIGAVLGQVVHNHAIHQAAVVVRQYDGIVLGADFEIGMGHAGGAVRPILAGAEHHIVPVGRHHRALGEAPLEGLVFLVAQGVVVQADGAVGGVVQFNPVAQLAILVGQAGDGVGHDFVDDQRAVGHHAFRDVGLVPRLGVFIPGAVQGGGGEAAVHQGPAFIPAHDGAGGLVDQVGVGVEQVHRLSHGGQLEFGMIGPAGLGGVGVRAEHHHPLVRLQRHVGEQEADGIVPVAQAHVFQADGRVRAVPHLHPVAVIAVLVGHGGLVGGHHFADDQALIGGADAGSRALHMAVRGAGGVGCPGNGILRAHQHNQRHQRDKDNQRHHHADAALFSLPAL